MTLQTADTQESSGVLHAMSMTDDCMCLLCLLETNLLQVSACFC